MNATSVKLKTLGVSDSEDTEVEDFVTRIEGPGDFYLNNVHVRTDTGTAFEGGTINDILIGSHLEVSGPLRNGILTAASIEFEDEVELVANVESVTPAANSLTLLGLNGLTVTFDGRTDLSGQGNPTAVGDLAGRRGHLAQVSRRTRIVDDERSDFECIRNPVVIFDHPFHLIMRDPGMRLDQGGEDRSVSRDKTADLHQRVQDFPRIETMRRCPLKSLVNLGLQVYGHDLSQYHETEAVGGCGLDDPFDRFLIGDGVGSVEQRVVGAVFDGSCAVDEDDHAEFQPVYGAAGFVVDAVEGVAIVVFCS